MRPQESKLEPLLLSESLPRENAWCFHFGRLSCLTPPFSNNRFFDPNNCANAIRLLNGFFLDDRPLQVVRVRVRVRAC